MTTFADDFNRADGDLGNGWAYQAGFMKIASQQAYTTLNRSAWRVLGSGSFARVGADFLYNATPSLGIGFLFLKGQDAGVYHYRVTVGRLTGGITIGIVKWGTSSGVTLASRNYAFTPGTYIHVELQYDAGALTAYVDGVQVLSATNSEYAAQTYMGFGFAYLSCRADNFAATDAPPVAFDAEPEELVEMPIPEEVQFTGEGTAWEPGTPGQPIFTVDKGTLDSQTVTSATTAAAMYTPPQAEDDATFTDPSTGLTDQIHLSTGFQVDGGSGLSEEAVQYIEDSAAQNGGSPGVILSTNTPVTPYGTGISLDLVNARLYAWVNTMAGDVPQAPPTMSLFDTLWWILNGHGDVDEDHNVLDYAGTAAVEATNAVLQLDAIRTDELLTLQSVLDAIAALSSADLQAILDELAAIRTPSGYTLYSLITEIQAARGVGQPTIANVKDNLEAYRTVANYTVDDLLTAIRAVQGADLPSIADVLDALDAGIEVDLSAVLTAISGVRGADSRDLTQVYNQLTAIRTAGNLTLGSVTGAIADTRGLDARDLTEVYDAIQALPQQQVSLQPVLDAVSNLSTQLTNTRSDILAAIAAIRPADYPLWPGASNVEYGTAIPLTGDAVVDGPMDGILVHITLANPKQLSWQVNGISNYKWAGYIAFTTDHGDAESHQYLGLTYCVYVPKHMLTAAACLVHLSAGVQATVTPWVYTP